LRHFGSRVGRTCATQLNSEAITVLGFSAATNGVDNRLTR
jgi:hypothetical protein